MLENSEAKDSKRINIKFANMQEEDKNIELLTKISLYEKNLGIDTRDKYTNGECDSLVYYFLLLNNMRGDMIRLSEIDKDDDTKETIHFIYESVEGNYYDVNGKFSTIEDLLFECDLYKTADDVNYDYDGFSLSCVDIDLKEKGVIDIVNIVEDIKKGTKFDEVQLCDSERMISLSEFKVVDNHVASAIADSLK